MNFISLLKIQNQLISLQCHVNLASKYTPRIVPLMLLTLYHYNYCRTCSQSISLTNPLDVPVKFKCHNTNTKHFIIIGIAEGQVYFVHAYQRTTYSGLDVFVFGDRLQLIHIQVQMSTFGLSHLQ